MLTISQAKKALADTFRVPPEDIELTIQRQLVYLACTCADTTTAESRMLIQ
jgi:hypothetical protein